MVKSQKNGLGRHPYTFSVQDERHIEDIILLYIACYLAIKCQYQIQVVVHGVHTYIHVRTHTFGCVYAVQPVLSTSIASLCLKKVCFVFHVKSKSKRFALWIYSNNSKRLIVLFKLNRTPWTHTYTVYLGIVRASIENLYTSRVSCVLHVNVHVCM